MICEICKKEYKSISRHIKLHNVKAKEYYDNYIKKEEEGLCSVCGKKTPFLNFTKGYQKHCCSKCAQSDENGNNLFKLNNPQKNIISKEKTKKTNLKLFGCTSPAQNKQIQQKMKQSCLNKYGVENIYQLPNIQIKARKNSHTTQANYQRTKTINDKIQKIAKENDCIYIQDLLNQTKSSGWYQIELVPIHKIDNHLFIKNSDIQTVLDYDNTTYKTFSKNEKKIVSAIVNNGYDVIENSRKIISPKELDIYIYDLNLAIEYNGVYYHSDLANCPNDYHLEKSLLCREKGIRLIHIYEFEDLEEQISLIINLINGIDKFPKNDFNKNNLIDIIPKPEIIYSDKRLNVYGAGPLIKNI